MNWIRLGNGRSVKTVLAVLLGLSLFTIFSMIINEVVIGVREAPRITVGDKSKVTITIPEGLAHPGCPKGWHGVSASDEHTAVLTCSKGSWTVFLHPDGAFSHAWQEGVPRFEFDLRRVPEWPPPPSPP